MTLRCIQKPQTQPITLDEAKAHLRVTSAQDDAVITRLIAAATSHIERHCGRALINQVWENRIDAFPEKGGAIELPLPPVSVVTTLKYIDIDGVEQALIPELFELDSQSETAWLVPAYGYTWPIALEKINAVAVTFTCGYGAAADVPDDIKAALLLLIGHLYENREAVIVDARLQALELPMGVDMLLAPYKTMRYV